MSNSKTFIHVRSTLVAKGLTHYIMAIAPSTTIEFVKTSSDLLTIKNTLSPIIFLDLEILIGEPGLIIEKIKHIYSSCVLIGLSDHQINDRLRPYLDHIIFPEEPEDKIANIFRLIYQPVTIEYSGPDNIQIISNREIEILKNVAHGYTNKEISDNLNISVHTVITHRKNITFKLGIKTIAGLTVYAILRGLISAEEVKT
jgi:DNA-binding CsgD family transcriptional regulator